MSVSTSSTRSTIDIRSRKNYCRPISISRASAKMPGCSIQPGRTSFTSAATWSPIARRKCSSGAESCARRFTMFFGRSCTGAQYPPLALARLNADAQGAAQRMSLVPSARGAKGSFVWKYDDRRAFDRVLWPIARAAADLLTSDQLPYVRACSSKTCEWFFLDTSKGRRRRWCDMTRCGNRAKGQRFYARRKKSGS